MGQNTEEVFYELADEYGMLVWNNFWESTQNYNTDNYVSLLPGQSQTIEIEAPAEALNGAAEIALRGWNTVPRSSIVK